MREVEVEFLDEYKKLDKLLKDKFTSDKGVSEYIDRMYENKCFDPSISIVWNNTLKKLKHVKDIRNDIVHSDSSECTEEDLDFIIDFYDEVMSLEDPLTKLSIYNRNKTINKNTNITIDKQNDLYEKDNKTSPLTVFLIIMIIIVLAIVFLEGIFISA